MAFRARPGSLECCWLGFPKEACVALGIEANVEDLGGPKELWFGLLGQLNELLGATGGLEVLERVQGHARGVVILVHGSAGIAPSDLRYVRMLAGMGFLVVAADSMLMSRRRRRGSALPLAAARDPSYWGPGVQYETPPAGDLAYSTDSTKVCENREYYKLLYESVFWERHGELSLVMRSLPLSVQKAGVFLLGNSEGGMVVSRFDEREVGVSVLGRIISCFGMEYCYYTATWEASLLGGSPDVPVLQWIGTKDRYFGKEDSVARRVVADPRGYGDPDLEGNGFKPMCARGVKNALVCLLEGAQHDATLSHDAVLRKLLAAFLAEPMSCSAFGPRLNEGRDEQICLEAARDGSRALVRVMLEKQS